MHMVAFRAARRRRRTRTPPTVSITAPTSERHGERHRPGDRGRERQRRRRRRPVLRRRRRPPARRTRPLPTGSAGTRGRSANGAHTLTARARDAAGNTTTSAPVTVNVANTDYFQNEILATGFDLPTTIEFLPDGRMLVAELAGTIKVLPPPYTQPDPTPFLQITNIGSAGVQQGIYDIALDPNFATNHYYYVFYTLGTPNHDRLSRFTANADAHRHGPRQRVRPLPGPAERRRRAPRRRARTSATTASSTSRPASTSCRASSQHLTSPRGKIHRINPDGTIPTDNPFYDGAGPERGLDLGPRAAQSVPRLLRRADRPALHRRRRRQRRVDRRSRRSTSASRAPTTAGRTARGPARRPARARSTPTRTTAATPRSPAASSTTARQFPRSYEGSLLLRRLHPELDQAPDASTPTATSAASSTSSRPTARVDGPYGDIVYLTEGPDGALYYVDLGYSDISGTFGVSKIRRIRYVRSNQAPVADASANPTSGPAPLDVDLLERRARPTPRASRSPTRGLRRRRHLDRSQPLAHLHRAPGSYTARLTVSDGVNTTLSTPLTISVGNVPDGDDLLAHRRRCSSRPAT